MAIFNVEKSINGIFCALYESFTKKIVPISVLSEKSSIPCLGTEVIQIETDLERAERVGKALKTYAGEQLIERMKLCLLSKDARSLTAVFNVGYLTLINRKDVCYYTEDQRIAQFVYIEDKITRERKRLLSELKFTETEAGILYAPFSPEGDLISTLAPIFFNKYKEIAFLLHDIKRGKVFASNGYSTYFTDTGITNNLLKFSTQIQFDNLWKECYRHILSQKKRTNLKRLKNY